MVALLADVEVTRLKVKRELDLWKANSRPEERGWILLGYDELVPAVEIAFLSRVAISTGSAPLSVVVCAIRLTYENYDLWPPSLTFIDAFTRQPIKPHVRAFMPTPEGPRDALIDGHPLTGQAFLCLPGIREYHTHPQHSGDDWLIHRAAHEGSIANVCERIWRLMSRNVLGIGITTQALPMWPLQAQVTIHLAQGLVDSAVVPVQQQQGKSVQG